MSRSSSFSSRIGIVTGIEAETLIARRLSSNVRCAGGRPEIAATVARGLVNKGATSLMSFGIAGGLSPELQPGALIVADRVITAEGGYTASTAAAQALDATIGPIYGGEAIVAAAADKAALSRSTGALAVDCESGAVARIAAERGVPFIVIRAVADPAWRSLPPAALLPLDREGRPRMGAILASVIGRPGQIAGLIATGRDTRAALKALARAVEVLRR